MHEALFFFIHSIAHQSSMLDTLIIFSAEYLHWWLALGATVFLYFTLQGMRRFYAVLCMYSGAAIAWGSAQILKIFIDAPRPFQAFPDITPLFLHGGNDAFPSGHATFSFALATALFYYNRPVGVAAYLAAAVISIARVAAGVHFPLDIFAGAVLGAGVMAGFLALVRCLPLQVR